MSRTRTASEHGEAAAITPALEALAERARRCVDEGRYRDAGQLFGALVTLSGRHPNLLNGLGVCRAGQGDPVAAIDLYREALHDAPYLDSLWNNLGNALNRLGRSRAAVQCLSRARTLAPGVAAYAHNLGLAHYALGEDARAIAQYEEALTLGPGNPGAIEWDLARALLRSGQLDRGWVLYASRWSGAPKAAAKPACTGAAWRGEPYPAQRLLVWSEQGFGDVIQASRYLAWAAGLGGELVFATRPELMRLYPGFKTLPRGNGVAIPGDFDWNCSILDLPRLHRATGEALPAGRYLDVPPAATQAMAARLPPRNGRLRVGVVWSGSVTFPGNATRALSCDRLLGALAGVPGIELYSLQKGEPAAELLRSPWRGRVIDLMEHCHDFTDTAALIDSLDLVVMTDSAVAHLAGALGRPVWVLLEHAPHWLWGLSGSQTDWYPSMRFHRQPCSGAWDDVLDAVAAELFALDRSRRPRPRAGESTDSAAIGIGPGGRPR